ncbi:MAG: MBL fold metallo-hydrolase, partial [Zymomonas sp.]
VTVVDQPHGAISSAGLRFSADGKALGYATDFNVMTPAMQSMYETLDVWVVDALRHHPHPTHPHLAVVLEWIARFRPGRALLTHMDQSMDYATLAAALPARVEPAYDGLEMTV